MNPIDFPRSNFTRKTILENPFPFELKTKTKNSKNRFYDLIRFLLKHQFNFQTKIFTFRRNISIYNFQKIRLLGLIFLLSFQQYKSA
ncbi:hypothetical protein LEP1GSC049_1699 [Leptospira kirschneri serovar Cynopteri str. 3522 CT]|nr:hypothetical protein LEP1GSC065_1240 [Leptospira kirschneri serovar Sokoine str. RM1]EPG51644.1 hypothetical protein LEP1GSC049_1699 [Leptospira kirschneri serovar Cynopteri str. 3522 CT]